MTAVHNIDDEREVWNAYAESTRDKVFEDAEPTFCWTQYAGHGPGPEILGDPETVLEIGCGTGRHLAFLAAKGVKCIGLDLSPVMVENITERWGSLGAQFICGEVLDHLTASPETYDAIYSIFGAAWFTDPERLFPLVAARLNSGGVFAFAQPPAIPGAYGPQGMYKGGFAGPERYTYRYSHTPRTWEDLLCEAGFVHADAQVINAPKPGHIGTLLVRAVRP
ncbi:class I SAM-dependent DNA methyltransferase [Streptomyces sirii]|uniref:class I SAM-dependent DNA methyltransferase n=1 Tax=Streptomyces sirii TaxID=3127701 RepID=UPI003D365E0E